MAPIMGTTVSREDDLCLTPNHPPQITTARDMEQESLRATSELAARKHAYQEEARISQHEADTAVRALRAQLKDAREQHERSAIEVHIYIYLYICRGRERDGDR